MAVMITRNKSTMTMLLAAVIFVVSCFSQSVMSTEFQVGDDKGWSIPNTRQEDRDFYNEWASKHRFKINDTVHFKYEKDSVVVVTEAEYDKCKASHPIFFSNNEDTVFKLDRSGLFYFISGVSGHCERGQKMIIKVLEVEQEKAVSPSSSSAAAKNATTTASPPTHSDHKSGAAVASSNTALLLGVGALLAPFLG
ncbi:unnamed protein product [Rhodiola kirilowii]